MTGGNPFQSQASRQPGALLLKGLAAMDKFLAQRVGGEQSSTRFAEGEGPLAPVAVRYLTTVLQQAQSNMTLRNSRELRTLAEAIDFLVQGKVVEAGDILAQRFKAVELAATEGSWKIAQHMELIPPSAVSASTYVEKEKAAQREVREARVRRALAGDPPRSRSPGDAGRAYRPASPARSSGAG